MYRRRFMYVAFTIPVVISVLGAFTGCRKSAAVQTTVVTGELTDPSTGTIVPNANIQLVQYVKSRFLDTGSVHLVTKTDEKGRFRLAFEGSNLTNWYVKAERNDSVQYESSQWVNIGTRQHVVLTAVQGVPARLRLIVRRNESDLLLLNFKPARGGPIDTTIRLWGFREPETVFRIAVNDEGKRILRGRAIPLRFVPGNAQPLLVEIPDMMQLPELY